MATQKASVKIIPRDRDDNHLLLSRLGLPQTILNVYLKKKIKKMFSWQYECFCKSEVLEGKNLVICAPTSAGKMLIAPQSRQSWNLKEVIERFS